MSGNNSEPTRPKASIDEDKSILPFLKNSHNLKEEPDIEHSEERKYLAYEDSVNFHNDCEIKIEEIDLKAECFNGEIKDSFDSCNLREIITDHNNKYESTASCSSRQIDAVHEEQLDFAMGKKDRYDNDREDDEHHTNINNEENIRSTGKCKKRNITSTEPNVCNKELTQGSKIHKIYARPHVCDVCNKGFQRPSHLLVHKRIHTGEKPYVCEVCDKGFTESGHLVRHKHSHTSDKPYVCDVCNKRLRSAATYKIHRRMHTGEKRHVCGVCNRRFTHLSSLVAHKNTHTGDRPYVCDVCNKGVSTSSSLQSHKRTHTGAKPYVCDICNKGFAQSSGLATHKLTHTGVKPHVCDVCNKGFTYSKTLLAHKRIHTRDKP